MIEITIKTLDSQNHSFSVEDDTTVKQFKEKIFEKLPFPVDSQRLIYCGRVLQDDKNLSEYDVNGKVIHLVQRPPPSASTPSAPTNRAPGSGARPASRERRFGVQGFRSGLNGGNAMYLGAMTIPTDMMDPNSVPQGSQSLSQSRLSVARRMLRAAAATLTLLEGGEATAASGTATPPEEAGTSSESNEDNGSPPPATASVVQDVGVIVMANDEGANADSAFIQPATAAVIASAFSAARSSGVPSHMTISRSSPGSEAVSLSVDMDARGNITHVNGDDFQASAGASSSSSETPVETSPDETETPAASRRPPSVQRRLLRQGYARPATMATLMDDLARANARLQPFQERFATMLREDASHAGDEAGAAASNLLFSRVSDVLHSLAHAQHALSDVMCDFTQATPRILRCRPVLVQHSAVLQAGIPISAQISMLTTPTRPTGPQAAPTAPTAPTADEATQAPPAAANQGAPPAPGEEQPTNPNAPRVRILRSGMPQFTRVPPAMGNMSPNNMEFIMEVGPGSITIDSVEATLLSGNASVTLGSLGSIDASMLGEGGGFPWGSPAPPEFIQNLMQAVAGHMINRSTAGDVPATTAAAASTENPSATPNAPGQNSQARGNTATHPTTSTQTRSTSRPHVHLASHASPFGANAFDPFLPCNSHHVVRPSSRRMSRRSEAPRAASSPTPTAGQARPTAQPMPTSSMSANVGPTPNAEMVPLAEMIRRIGEQAHLVGCTSAPPEVTFPVVEDLMRNMTHVVAAASEGNRGTTLADMFYSMPNHPYVEGQYLVSDLFMVAARNLTLEDMFALGSGRTETLNALQPQLRTFFTQRSMENEPVSAESLRRGAGRLSAELRQHLDILREGRMRPDVDVVQTIDQFNESRLAQMMEMVVLEGGEEGFGQRLVAWFRGYIREMLSILHHCCIDGMAGLERILTQYVHLVTSGVPSAIQEWTAASTLGHLRTFMGANMMPAAQIERFLQRPCIAAPPPEFADLPVDEGTPLIPGPAFSGEPEPMETDAVPVESVAEEIVVPLPEMPDLVPIPAATLPVIIPEAWHGSIPSDWVPIISRDSQRQRRQSPQAPFSDAYLSGMPSKRRKVVASGKPQGSLGQVISDGVRQAVEASGAANAAVANEAAEASGAAVDVQTAYRAQVRSAVAETLGNNPDFTPERFPNAAKYFTKK